MTIGRATLPKHLEDAVIAWYAGEATYEQLEMASEIPGELIKLVNVLSDGDFTQYQAAAAFMHRDLLEFRGRQKLRSEGIS